MEIQLNLGFSHDEFLELLEILSGDFSSSVAHAVLAHAHRS